MDGRKRDSMKWALIWAFVYLPNENYHPHVTTVEMYNSKHECQDRQQYALNTKINTNNYKVSDYYADDTSTNFFLKGLSGIEKKYTYSIQCIKLNYESK